jgi:protein-S-isoprenylcysteine O-methyltransferase Ste14
VTVRERAAGEGRPGRRVAVAAHARRRSRPNWASLAALVVIPVLGHLPRIVVEDALLADRLGEPYRAYARTTAPLVPGVW